MQRDRLVVVHHQHREAHQAPRQRQRWRHPRTGAGPGEPAQGQAWSKGEAALRGLAVLAISVVLTLYGLFRRLRRQSVLVVPVLALGATAAAPALSSEALGLPAELTPLQRALVSLSIAFNAALVMRIFSGK